jgi:type I restriction enzyme S subunit
LVISTGLAVLSPKILGPAEIFAATDEQSFVDYLMTRADGSAYPAVRASAFQDAEVALLGTEASARFESELWPLWQFAGELTRECETLQRTRDELLPLLLSGRVSVREVAA